jgi:hypothetical protein
VKIGNNAYPSVSTSFGTTRSRPHKHAAAPRVKTEEPGLGTPMV